MDDSNVWLPHLDILQLAYEKNKSYFHSLNHALRVWAFSMLISENYQDKVDIDVISAATLFHAVRRKSDWGDDLHAQRSAKWIEENLLNIDPNLTKEQVDLVVATCRRQDSHNHKFEPLELKIFSDANLLDKHRLLRKKISLTDFALPESKDHLPLSKKFYKTWKKNSSKVGSDPFQILKESLRNTPELRKYSSFIDLKQIDHSIKRSQETFLAIERELNKLETLCTQFQLDLTGGELTRNKIKALENVLNEIDTMRDENCLTCEAGYYCARSTVKSCLKRSLPDLTLSGKERKAIRKLYQKAKETITSYETFTDPYSSIIPLLSNRNYYNCPLLTSSLRNFLAYNNDLDLLNLINSFTVKEGSVNFYSSLAEKDLKITDLDLDLNLNGITRESWVLLRVIEKLIITSKKLPEEERNTTGTALLTYSIKIINSLIRMYDLTVEEAHFLLLQINKIVSSTITLEKGLVDTLFKNFQDDFESIDGITTIKGGLISDPFNVFHQFDGDPEGVKDLMKVFEETLLSFYKRSYRIDGVIRCYLLPVALNKDLDYSMDQEVFDSLEDKESIELIEKYNTLIKKNQDADIQELTHLYIKENSRKNIQQLTNQSKHHALVLAKNDYRIVSKALNFEIIESVLMHDSFLLSPFNIVDTNPESMSYRDSEKKDYQIRLQELDALQRYTLTRKPDVSRKHLYYGTLQSMKDLLAKDGILDKVPSPYNYIPKKKFGKIILVFKERIADRSFFTMHDSIWENRTIPVLFDEAKYLYEEINSERLASLDESRDGSEIQIEKPFVEASVLGGVEMEDIEMIIAPKNLIEKHKATVDHLLEKYHQIEVMGV